MYICTTTLHTCVVLIGIFIAVECFFSNVSFVASLDLFHLVRTYNHSLTILSESFLILVLCVLSVGNAVWLSLQVRSLWTRHFLVLIQFLHAVPSFLLLTQSLLQGMLMSLPLPSSPPSPSPSSSLILLLFWSYIYIPNASCHVFVDIYRCKESCKKRLFSEARLLKVMPLLISWVSHSLKKRTQCL